MFYDRCERDMSFTNFFSELFETEMRKSNLLLSSKFQPLHHICVEI